MQYTAHERKTEVSNDSTTTNGTDGTPTSDEDATDDAPIRPGNDAVALVPSSDFLPGRPFRVVGILNTNLKERILTGGGDGTGVTRVPSPGNFNAFVVVHLFERIPRYSLLFVPIRRIVRRDRDYILNPNATYLSGSVNLLKTTISTYGV